MKDESGSLGGQTVPRWVWPDMSKPPLRSLNDLVQMPLRYDGEIVLFINAHSLRSLAVQRASVASTDADSTKMLRCCRTDAHYVIQLFFGLMRSGRLCSMTTFC